jgi:hypothetical protein
VLDQASGEWELHERGGGVIIRKLGTITTGITVYWLSILEGATTGLLSIDFTTPYSVDATTYSIAT